TVLRTHADRVVLDVGAKALGRDEPPWLKGHGTVGRCDGPVISRLFDHHAVVDDWLGAMPAPGDRVAVVPNNVNSALALQSAVGLSQPGAAQGVVIDLIHDT